MEIQKFVENFAAQFDDAVPQDFSPETRFRDIEGWSSLAALTIIAMVDEEYNVKVKGEDIRKSLTIEDLFNVVKGRV